MDNLESAKKLSGAALKEYARMLYEYNSGDYRAVIASLMRGGCMQDYERAAEMLEVSRTAAEGAWYDGDENSTARSVEQKNLYALLNICKAADMTEADCMPMLLSAGYASKDSALYRLDGAVEEYVRRRAEKSFDAIADLIDEYDKKYIKYRVLMTVNRERAILRLLNMAVYEKHINKAFVRDILMDCGDIAPVLFTAYKTANAHDRVAIVRLLLVMKNDARVREFLDETVKNDKSKSVRDLLTVRAKKHKGNAPLFFERLMAEGRPLCYAEWIDVLSEDDYAAVADRTFFCLKEGGATSVLVYNNGEFLDMTDRDAELDGDDLIFVLHPIDAPSSLADIFSSGIEQPFLQAARPVFHVMPGEIDCSYRFFGEMITKAEFDKNCKRVGFELCERRGGTPMALYGVGGFSVGVELDAANDGDGMTCGKLVFFRSADIVRIKRSVYVDNAPRIAVTDIPRREYSELVYCVRRLFRGDGA